MFSRVGAYVRKDITGDGMELTCCCCISPLEAVWSKDVLTCINEVLAAPKREATARTMLRVYRAWDSDLAFLTDLCWLEISKTGMGRDLQLYTCCIPYAEGFSLARLHCTAIPRQLSRNQGPGPGMPCLIYMRVGLLSCY